MAGHSKWAQIKRKKGVNDQKRGNLFTKLSKNISVAARNGKDPEMNAALRVAIDAAKRANMPKDNIEKAILKGAGELPGVTYEEIIYEGYGPGGIALVIECVTDNTNRSVSFVRSTLTKQGGSLGNSGSVLYMFEKKGVVSIAAEDLQHVDKDAIELAAIEAGADDIHSEEEGITMYTARENLSALTQAVEQQGVTVTSAVEQWVTPNMIDVDEKTAEQLLRLIETLEENEDVNSVFTNANI